MRISQSKMGQTEASVALQNQNCKSKVPLAASRYKKLIAFLRQSAGFTEGREWTHLKATVQNNIVYAELIGE
jgi:hypothetical protein